jgi:hypothetical protein
LLKRRSRCHSPKLLRSCRRKEVAEKEVAKKEAFKKEAAEKEAAENPVARVIFIMSYFYF